MSPGDIYEEFEAIGVVDRFVIMMWHPACGQFTLVTFSVELVFRGETFLVLPVFLQPWCIEEKFGLCFLRFFGCFFFGLSDFGSIL